MVTVDEAPADREKRAYPLGWTQVAIGEVAQINPRDSSLRELPDDLLVTFVPMAAVEASRGTIITRERRRMGEVRRGFTPFRNGDVIWAKITPCMENGKAAITRGLENGLGFGSTEFHVLRPEPGVLSEWLYHFIRQATFRENAKLHFAGAVGQQRVPAGFVRDYQVPLPPTAEQHRIVAAIEQHFTRLDAGVSALKRAQANLRRYRASVLKAACEGRLVPQDPSDEPASELLKRILAERRAKWEAEQLAKMQAASKVPKDDKWKEKYEEPKGPDTESLPQLSGGWCWARFQQLVARFRSGSTAVPQDGRTAFPILRSSSIRPRCIDYGHIRYVRSEDSRNPANYLRMHDLLFVRLSGSIEYVGNCAQVRSKTAFQIQYPDRIFCAALIDERLGSYVEAWFSTPDARRQIAALSKSAAGHQRVSMDAITQRNIPLPPLGEQCRIIAEVERRLSIVDQLEAVIESNLKRAERLRQAILKRAFEGKLVPQDPNDEPAGVLLERIRAEREARAGPKAEVARQARLL